MHSEPEQVPVEGLVLEAVRSHGPDCPSSHVSARLPDRKGDAAIALLRMVESGLATYRLGDPSPRHAGLRPRLYTLTPKGVERARRGPGGGPGSGEAGDAA